MLSPHEITTILVAVATLLGGARLLGELARRLHQPAVLGEILAGVLLGQTVLGQIAPGVSAAIFPTSGAIPVVLSGMSNIAIVLFLLVAGMEVDLSAVWRQGRPALLVSFAGMVIPFTLGFGLAWTSPSGMGAEAQADPLVFSLFFATALSISALPVIVKTLMDLNLFRSDLGMVVVAAAIVNDLSGWMVFSLVLGLMGTHGGGGNVPLTIGLTLAFAAVMLTLGRWVLNRVLPWLQAFASWPGGVLGFTATGALLCAALTEWIGIHAVFGSFLFGVAIGDSRHLRERTRNTLEQFVSFVFAPLFFASIGLWLDFAQHFDLFLVVCVLVVACTGKVLGGFLGAKLGGLPQRQAWAAGVALNSRGAMEVILGLLALNARIISERMFVALVIMAIVTSAASGPLLQLLLRNAKRRRFAEFTNNRTFLPALNAANAEEAIRELAKATAESRGLDPALVEAAVLERERMMPTGLEKGIAAPHARLPGLGTPLVGVGLCRRGVDFDTVDGSLCNIVVLTLTPAENDEFQLQILADVAQTLSKSHVQEDVLAAKSYTEFLAAVRAVDEHRFWGHTLGT
jgi:Kef-type K+ transport system membrane component KefB/mannitol/fructose-specific phosphotransferase system IIA component (Ntr-type)